MTPRRRVYPLLIVAATLAVFSNAFDNGYHLDDIYRIVDNPAIQGIRPIWRHFVEPRTMSSLDRITEYRPLLPLTLSVNFWLSGARVTSYHAFNLLAHLAAALLVYGFVLALMRFRRRAPEAGSPLDYDVAFLVALLFAVHPVSGIVVNYISARDLGMMQAFLMGALLTYVRMRRRGDSFWRWAVVLALFAGALFAKTTGVVMPALVFAFECLFADRSMRWRPALARSVPFAAVIIAFFSWTTFGLHFSPAQQVFREGGALSTTYPLTELWVHLLYLGNFLWPFRIREMPAVTPVTVLLDWRAVAGLVVIAGSLCAAWRLRRAQPIVSYAIAAYWLLLLPESSILPLYHFRVDYRPYAASPFLFLAAVLSATRFVRPKVVALATVAVTTYLAAVSFSLNRTWRTEETLWTHSLRYGGDEVAHVNLATAIADHRDPRVRTLLEEALRLSPGYVLAHINYGLLLIELGDSQAGLAQCEEAVRLAPTWAQAHRWLAVANERLGHLDAAASEASTAAELDPGDLRQQYQAAVLLQRAGRYQESLPILARVSARAGDYALTTFMLAFGLQQTGEIEPAIDAYRLFLARYPDHGQAHFNLGYALMTRGDCRAAIEEFERTVVLQPDYRDVHLRLAECYAKIGDSARAAEERRRYAAP